MVYLNLSYDYVASFFMFMLLIWYFSEKKVPLISYRYFAYVLVTAFLASVLEVATFTMVKYPDIIPFNVVYTIMSWQMLFIHAFITSLTFCLYSMARIKIKSHRWLLTIFSTAWGLEVIICVLNPGLHWAAVLENGQYRAVGMGNVLYVIDAVMVIMIAWVVLTRRQEFKFLKQSLVILLMICAVISGVAQLFGYAPMLNLMITVFCLIMYLFQQSPDAVTDKVTEQFTRAFFGEFIQDRYSENRNFSLIVLDIDDFKLINQNYGISVGDVLLFQVGKYLEGLNTKCKVFHLDADQFGVVIENEGISPEKMAKDIKSRFGLPWIQDKKEIIISATICIIRCPDDADNPLQLLEVIEYAMEMAKKEHKGQISHISDMDMDQIQMVENVEKAIKDAIEAQSIMVYYQPIFSVKKQGYTSAEALVRLYDDKMGWISPDLFIPIAEKSGYIIEIGDIVLHKVCEFIQKKQLAQTEIEFIDINISPQQLMQKGFAKRMLDVMEQYGVEHSQIIIEITETSMMSSFAVVSENVMELVNHGVLISLDDYGSGYANVNYINNMPFKIIKLDKDIVQASVRDEKAGITLEHTINMLNALKLIIVAEGIETDEMREKLLEFGCQYMQGWYYAKALPEDAFMELIKG